MQKISLIALGRHELEHAVNASSGRSAKTIFGGHTNQLRQTLIAFRAGQSMAEHESPGEATLQVLSGQVILRVGADSWTGSAGDWMPLPREVHSLDAVEDSVVLLTVSKDR